MINTNLFKKSKEFHVSSYEELINLCKSLRNKDPKAPYTIHIDGNDKEIGNYKFTFSYFHIISHDHELDSTLYANMKDENNNDLTTWKTAAIKITGSHNVFENLDIRNISFSPEIKGQEVAIGIYGDDNIFINCTFKSTQDTLFVGPLPDDLSTRYLDFLPDDERYFEGNTTNYFSNCNIYGSVDFIFGAGKAVFDNCNLITVADKRNESYVVASANSLKDDFGYLFYECNFKKEVEVEDNTVYLARPWRDYAKAVFAYCNYESHIHPDGFHDWSNVNRIRTARFLEYPLKESRVSWTYNKKGDKLDDKYINSVLELRKSIL